MIIAVTRMTHIPEACVTCDLFRVTCPECMAKGIMFGKEDVRWLTKERPNWCTLQEVEVTQDVKDLLREDP